VGFIQPYGSRNRIVCPAKSSGGRFQRSLRLVNKYGSVYRQFVFSYSRLLSAKECADILALPSDAHGVWVYDHEFDPSEPFKS
jgi:hypothetical protein